MTSDDIELSPLPSDDDVLIRRSQLPLIFRCFGTDFGPLGTRTTRAKVLEARQQAGGLSSRRRTALAGRTTTLNRSITSALFS